MAAGAQYYHHHGRGCHSLIEQTALRLNRTLLVLDTLQGCDAERLYRRLGYQEVGPIPNYVYLADGSQGATVVFYRSLA